MVFTLIIGILCYLNWTIKGNRRLFYIIATVVLACYAYFVIPERGMDLYSHYAMLHSFRSYGLETTVQRYPWLFRTLPIYSFYFNLVSKIGFDQALLMITYALIYGGQFSIVSMACKDSNAGNREEQVATTLVLLATNAYYITTIRNVTAFIVAACVLYIDVVKKEHRPVCYVAYILLCLLHDSVILIVVMRLMLLLVKKKCFRPVLILIAFWPLIITWIIDSLNSTGIQFLLEVANKLAAYSGEEANAMWVGGRANRIMITFQSLLIIITVFRIWFNRQKKKSDSISDIEILFTFIALFCIGGIVNIAIAIRYYVLAMYLLPAMHIITNGYKKKLVLSVGQTELDIINVLAVLYFVSLIVFQYSSFKLGF